MYRVLGPVHTILTMYPVLCPCTYSPIVMCYSARQAGFPAPVRGLPGPGRAGTTERGVRHRVPCALRVSGAAHQAEDPAGQTVLRPAARGSTAGPPRLRMDARRLL